MGIKHLIQENPTMDLNLVRLISKLDPSKTNKLTPFMVKVFKKRMDEFEKEVSQEHGIYSRYEYVNSKMSDASGFEKLILTWVIDQFRAENIEILKEFNEVLDKEPGYFGWIQNAEFPLYTKKVLTGIKLRKLNTKS